MGSDITMPCEATGNPKPEIFWLKGNLDVSVFGRRFQVLPDGTLTILQVQEVDEDQYTCVANNAISRRSQPAYLSVLSKCHGDIRSTCLVYFSPRCFIGFAHLLP